MKVDDKFLIWKSKSFELKAGNQILQNYLVTVPIHDIQLF